MLATALLAAITLAIGLALHAADRTDRHAQDWTAAFRATQKAVERVLALEYSEIPAQDGVEFVVCGTAQTTAGTIQVQDVGVAWGGAAGGAYRITAAVQDTASQLDVSMTTVRSGY